MLYDIIILGSGPAGLTSALYAARAGKSTLVLGGDQLGGQMSTIHVLENYPGTPGVNGFDLANTMKTQCETFGAKVVFESAVNIKEDVNSADPHKFIVKTDKGNEFQAKAVIIGTGAKPRRLEAVGIREFTGRGVSYCATCDGFFYSGKDVIVVGGGNSALSDALYLANVAETVKILYRKDSFGRAEQVLIKRVEEAENIEVLWKTEIAEVGGDDTGVTHIVTTNGDKIDCDAVFVAIGHEANTDYLDESIKRDNLGRLAQVDLPAGMYVCGDVQSGLKMQIATAVGAGCDVAMDAIAYVNKLGA